MNDSITSRDIFDVSDRLRKAALAYRGLILDAIRSFRQRKRKKDEYCSIIQPSHIGIDANQLFLGKRAFSFSLPKSFQIGKLTISFPDNLHGSFFVVAPENLKDPHDNILASNKSYENSTRALMPGKSLPKGYRLTGEIGVWDEGAYHWQNSIGAIIEYYTAALEPLLDHRVIEPTLDGINSLILLACDDIDGGVPPIVEK